jgi:uncharacterized membrane protein
MVTDPFVGSLIGIYFCIAVTLWTFLMVKLSYRLAKKMAIKEDSWWPVIIVPVCGMVAMILAAVWPLLLLSKVINRRESNVRS